MQKINEIRNRLLPWQKVAKAGNPRRCRERKAPGGTRSGGQLYLQWQDVPTT